MTDAASTRLDQLRAEEKEIIFPSFELLDAWRLGSRIVELSLDQGYAITVDIRRANVILFRSALPGSSPDQQHWIDGKSATALRLERSTAVLDVEFGEMDFDPSTAGWLPRPHYVVGGGSVPVRVEGVGVVAVVTVSGLSSEDDHDLVVTCMRERLVELMIS